MESEILAGLYSVGRNPPSWQLLLVCVEEGYPSWVVEILVTLKASPKYCTLLSTRMWQSRVRQLNVLGKSSKIVFSIFHQKVLKVLSICVFLCPSLFCCNFILFLVSRLLLAASLPLFSHLSYDGRYLLFTCKNSTLECSREILLFILYLFGPFRMSKTHMWCGKLYWQFGSLSLLKVWLQVEIQWE